MSVGATNLAGRGVPALQAEPLLPEVRRALCDQLIGVEVESSKTQEIYTFGDFIAEGGFARVYSCRDGWGNDLVAKVIKPITTCSFDLERDRAWREFSNLLMLRHRTIVQVYDTFHYNGLWIIIVERCAGTLANLLNVIKNPHTLFMPIARNVLEGLNFIHTNNLVHKDVHFHNVLYTYKQDAIFPDQFSALEFRLSDVGIAAAIPGLDPKLATFAPWQLPPEVQDERFGPLDRRVDIYHTALLLLNVSYGFEIKFTSQDLIDGAPREMALKLSFPWARPLGRALARHVNNRPKTAKEFWLELDGHR